MNHNKLSPVLVISIGPFAQEVAKQTARMYLASGKDRIQVSNFLALSHGKENLFDLVAIPLKDDDPSDISFPKPGSTGERQTFIEKLILSSEQIRATMGAAVHDLLAHEDLMSVGLDTRIVKPIYLFIVADLVDSMSAAALLPLSFLLQDISASNPHTHACMLANAAIIPNSASLDHREEASLYHALQDLDQAMISVSDQKYQKLFAAMMIREKLPLNMPVYLFDCRKLNYNNVQDIEELYTVFSNSLYGLMSGNLAHEVHRNIQWDDRKIQKLFYQSIGAANLIYDPYSLADASSEILARELISEGLLHRNPNNKTLPTLLSQSQQYFGSLVEWYTLLLTGAHYDVDLSEEQKPYVKDDMSLLTFARIDFEKIRETHWVDDIQNYVDLFNDELLPNAIKTVQDKSVAWVHEQLSMLFLFLEAQIENPALYPDGINGLREIINQLDQEIKQRKKILDQRQKNLKPKLKAIELDKFLTKITKILNKAPLLPKWWFKIPKFPRKPLSVLINLYWIILHNRKINRLKQDIREKLAEHHAAMIESDLIKALIMMMNEFEKQSAIFQNELHCLENLISQVNSQLAYHWEDGLMPLGNEKLCWNEPFRTPAVDLQFAKWAYQEYKPLPLPAIAQMIKEGQLLSEWKKLDGDTFRKRLLKLSRAHFDSLFDLSISDVLTIRQKLMLKEVGEPDKVAFDPVTPLLRAALPLMQPNFDAIGGEGDSIVKKYLQSENQESQFIIAALNNSGNERFISTEDRYTISAVTIQNLMPLAAFTALIDHLKDAYKRLSVPQKKKLENVFVPIPKLEGEDLEEKVFEWKFGQPEETLQIVLPISQKRYRHAKQESRLPIAEWVKYVVAESPELNYLSACFLNIFLQHPDWNPFEQTSAILAFVQHVITYAYDKDTTPKTDWPRYPIESLQEGIGDCEDSAILAAAIMDRLGFDVALLQLPGHCALGVAGVENMPGTYVTDSKTEQRYFYAESTGEGWQIGVLPDNHEGQNVEVYPVKRLIGE